MIQYLYDAEGRRVAKGTISVWSCDASTFSENEGYMIGPSDEQLTEVDGQGNPVHTNVFANGHLIATYDPQNIHFHLSDWLGTRRATTDYFGNIESTYHSLPFGEMMPQNQSLGATEHFFTGKERDAESGLDYFGARHYSSATGRFMSPDPSGLTFADETDPQSLNLYSYVRNHPLTLVDPDGLETAIYGDANCRIYTYDWYTTDQGGTLTVHNSTDSIGRGCDGLQNSINQALLQGKSVQQYQQQPPNLAPSKPCTVSQRAQLFGNGVLNLALAAGKFTAAAGVEAGTSGIGTALALYGVYSGAGNLTTGLIQTVGAFSSNPGQFQQAAAVSSVAGSAAGLTTLLATNGNLTAASHAARFENFGLFGLRGGLGGSFNPLSATGTAVNAAKEMGVPIGCH
jgi:RHS repeat-associated protein